MKKSELKALIKETIEAVNASHTRNKLKNLVREIIEESLATKESKYLNDRELNQVHRWSSMSNKKKSIEGIIAYAMKEYKVDNIEDLDKAIHEKAYHSYEYYGQQSIGPYTTVDLGIEPFLAGAINQIIAGYEETIE